MKVTVNYIWTAASAGILVIASSPAYAQSIPKTDVSFGYQWQHISICQGVNCKDSLPAGWYADVSRGISRVVALVGQFDGSYKTGAFSLVQSNDVGFNMHTYSGGVRIAGPATVAPFAQFLVGGARRVFLDPRPGFGSPALNAFMIDIGAGVNFRGARRLGARVGVDYRRGYFGDRGFGNTDAVRVNVGAVVSLSR